MDNSVATLQCQNITCLASNPETNQVCQKCGTPIVRRYLRTLGEWTKTYYHPGDILEERYLCKQSQIFIDTKPALSPQAPEEFPAHISNYLRLFPYRLHIPQIYGYIPPPDEELPNMEIWFLEYGMIPLDESGELRYPDLLPELSTVWAQASAMRQLQFLWQMARLWQPLKNQGVVSSLLNPSLLRVNDRNIQLFELENDSDKTISLKQLGELWSKWQSDARSQIKDFFAQVCEHLQQEKINRPEQLVSLLDQGLLHLGRAQKRTYQVFTQTDTGSTREHNEDACYPPSGSLLDIDEEHTPLAIVCDGIGGQEGGEIASNLAIETLLKEVGRFYVDASVWNPDIHIQAIERAIRLTNDLISNRNDSEHRHERQRMGTTVVLGLGYNHEMYVANVGDSRVYLITPESCYQITIDDDLASREVRLGYLIYRDAIQYPNAGALVQALGMAGASSLHPNVQRFILDEDCIFLLCSDGLSDYDRVEQFWQSYILPIWRENKSVAEVGQELINLANERNGHDNITVGLISCKLVHREGFEEKTLDFLQLESLVSSLCGPTLIENGDEQEEETSLQNKADETPTLLSAASETPTPSSEKKGFSPLFIILIALGLIALGLGIYFGRKLIFNNPAVNPSPSASPSPYKFSTPEPDSSAPLDSPAVDSSSPTPLESEEPKTPNSPTAETSPSPIKSPVPNPS